MHNRLFEGTLIGGLSNRLFRAKPFSAALEGVCPFPENDECAVHRAIWYLIKGTGSIDQVARAVRHHPQALLTGLDINDIASLTIWPDRPTTYVFNATSATPLHYAYLAGRLDAVEVCLAAGADVYRHFSYEETKFPLESDEFKCQRNVSLYSQLSNYQLRGTAPSLLATTKMREVLFMFMLRNKDSNAMSFFTAQLDMLIEHKNTFIRPGQPLRYFDKIRNDVRGVFEWIPTIEDMEKLLKPVTLQHAPYFTEMYQAMINLKQELSGDTGRGRFMTEESCALVLPYLDKMIAYFNGLVMKATNDMTADQYRSTNIEESVRKYMPSDQNANNESYLAATFPGIN